MASQCIVKRKQVECFCCAAGTVEFVAKLPGSGYCVVNDDVLATTYRQCAKLKYKNDSYEG